LISVDEERFATRKVEGEHGLVSIDAHYKKPNGEFFDDAYGDIGKSK
jgi:hypothetical protein